MLHGNPTWSFYLPRAGPRPRADPPRASCPTTSAAAFRTSPATARVRLPLAAPGRRPGSAARPARSRPAAHAGGARLGRHDRAGLGRAPPGAGRAGWCVLNTAAFLIPRWQAAAVARCASCARYPLVAEPAVLRLQPLRPRRRLDAPRQGPAARRCAAACSRPTTAWRNRLATLRFVQDIPLQPGRPELSDWPRWSISGLARLGRQPDADLLGERDFVFDLRLPRRVAAALAAGRGRTASRRRPLRAGGRAGADHRRRSANFSARNPAPIEKGRGLV